MEDTVVRPEVINGFAEAFLLMRSEEAAVVGILPPFQSRINLDPLLGYFSIRHHFGDHVDSQLRIFWDPDNSIDMSGSPISGAEKLRSRPGILFIGTHEFYKVANRAVRSLNSLVQYGKLVTNIRHMETLRGSG